MNQSIISQVVTSRKLRGIEPSRVTRHGFLWLRKRYEYNFNSRSLYSKAVRENPGVPVHRTAGIISNGSLC